MKKKLRIGVLFTIAALTVFSCTGKQDESAAAKNDRLIVATAYDAKSLDPVAVNDVASTNVMRQIYQPLVEIDNQGNILKGAGLASNIEKIDSVTYKFTIKKGIKFHNGEELKASDVKFSLERAAKAKIIAHIFGIIDPAGLKVEDDYTVMVKLTSPYSGFIPTLSHSGGYIVSEKAVTEAGDKYGTSVVVGTGPFTFVEWKKADKVILERFDGYVGAKPAMKTLEIRVLPEPNARAIALESGDVHIAYEIATNDISLIENNPDLKIYRIFSNSVQHLGMNVQKKPFDDVRVRQAIAYVVDMPAIVKAVYRGVGQAATGPCGPNVKYSIANETPPHEINIEKAKALLVEAGLADGFDLTLSTNEKKERVDMAQIIKEQLAQVGIDVKIEVLEWSAYLDMLKNGRHMMYEIGWSPSVPDPDMCLWAPLSGFSDYESANFCGYQNDRVDELLEKGRQVEDGPEREAMYREAQEIIIKEAPWVFQYNAEDIVGASKKVKNLELTPFTYYPLYKVSLED